MPHGTKRIDADKDDRRLAFLEVIAAVAIFSIVVVVLYMVFSYKPS